MLINSPILCLSSRMTVMSACIPEEQAIAYYRTCNNMCFCSHVPKRQYCRIKDASCRVSCGVLSDITVVLGMRQSIACFAIILHYLWREVHHRYCHQKIAPVSKLNPSWFLIRLVFHQMHSGSGTSKYHTLRCCIWSWHQPIVTVSFSI